MRSTAKTKAAQVMDTVRGLRLRLHRARAWISPLRTVAPEGVLSLDAVQNTTEDTGVLSPIVSPKSILSSKRKNNRLPECIEHFVVDARVTVLPLAAGATANSNQIKSLQRHRIDQIAFRPTGGLEPCSMDKIGRKHHFQMVRFDYAWRCRAEWHNGTKRQFAAWLRRNHHNRTPLHHLWNDESLVIAKDDLAGIWSDTKCHTPSITTKIANDNGVSYA